MHRPESKSLRKRNRPAFALANRYRRVCEDIFCLHQRKTVISIPSPTFALADTCRTIREEFLPLYKRKTSVSILLEDAPAYIDTWLSDPDKSVKERLVIRPALVFPRPAPDAIVDVKPLFNLRSSHPDTFDFSFQDYAGSAPVVLPRSLLESNDAGGFFGLNMKEFSISVVQKVDNDNPIVCCGNSIRSSQSNLNSYRSN